MTTKRPADQAKTVQFISLTEELTKFRQQLEAEAEEPIQGLEVNAALLLADLCQVLHLGTSQKSQILGVSAREYVQSVSETRARLPDVDAGS